MRNKLGYFAILIAASALSACGLEPPVSQVYWQRVEDNSALYMKGPKAQQQLHEDIASCVRQVDELVELDALRRPMRPDNDAAYLRSMGTSGDLEWYDTPSRKGKKNVAHKDFQDFEGCMRNQGWERVRFVRYEAMKKAKNDYAALQDMRGRGGVPGGNERMVPAGWDDPAPEGDFDSLND